jgi:alginate O-acetyltransferase complex protein AlgI
MLQIYFDFSAYSDMAIGLGAMFGFKFNENFNFPYISKSITEFWRRWHISLSTWFRDYIYIPLGGNRKGIQRQILNMFIVWLLTGLWHGASWNFVIWGLYYFVLLAIEKLFLGKLLEKLPVIVRWFYTIMCVLFGWVIFRIEYMTGVIKYIIQMLSFQFTEDGLSMTYVYLHKYGFYLLLGIIFSAPVYQWAKNTLLKKCKDERKQVILSISGYTVLFAIFGVSVLYLVNASYNPFIYFRF